MKDPQNAMMVIRIPAHLKQGIQRAAQENGRTLSGMVVRILDVWAAENGYAKKPTKRGGL